MLRITGPAIRQDATWSPPARRLGRLPVYGQSTREVSTLDDEKQPEAAETTRKPYRMHLPGFTSGEEVGLGEVIKRATSAIGVRPCGGCERRAAALNRWMTFSGRHLG